MRITALPLNTLLSNTAKSFLSPRETTPTLKLEEGTEYTIPSRTQFFAVKCSKLVIYTLYNPPEVLFKLPPCEA